MSVEPATIESILDNIQYATPDEQVEIQRLLEIELAQSSPAGFAQVASRKWWRRSRHQDFIDQAVMETVAGSSEPILIIETPPRHGKTAYICQHFASWYLGKYPERQVIMASATDELALSSSRKARSLLREHGQRYFGASIAEDRSAVSDWKTTQGGGMRAAGIGGDIIGRSGHLMLVDDYLRNPIDAQSDRVRESHWEWWQSTFLSRLEPGGIIVMICTRWHKDDLIGRIVRRSEEGVGIPVRRITLPAIAKQDDPIGREPGDALWPERWPLGKEDELVKNDWGEPTVGLRMRKRDMEPYMWLSLYQQEPTQHGRSEFPADYFHDEIWLDEWPELFEASAIAVDPSKGKDQKKGDYSAIVFVGLTNGRFHVDCSISRRPPEKIVTDGISAFRRFQPDVFGIEETMFQDLFRPIFDQKCEEMGVPPLPIMMINHRTEVRSDSGRTRKGRQVPKEMRIGRLGPYLLNDKLRFRRSAGCKILINQLQEFPLGDYDDGPDALEMAVRLVNHLLREPVDNEDYVFEVAVT